MSYIPQRLATALGDRYVLEREVGAGGMATVYLARDLRHKRSVALKVVRPELGGAEGVERFLREIELAARLQHPHILPVFDSGVLDDGSGAPVPYFVMPYVVQSCARFGGEGPATRTRGRLRECDAPHVQRAGCRGTPAVRPEHWRAATRDPYHQRCAGS